MLPYIDIFGHQFSMYALTIMIGIAGGILVAIFRSKVYEYSKEDVLYASFYGIIGIIVGGKILYLITILPWIVENFKLIISNAEYIMALAQGGFVFYGGFLGAVAGIAIYGKQYKLSVLNLIEIIIPAVPLIHAFGRVGCFCAGCCYGIPVDSPFGVYFAKSDIAPHDESLFPIQLVEVACNLVIFAIIMYKYYRKQTKGEALCFYLLTYGITRFVLEFFRYDAERGVVLGISTSQWISVILIVMTLIIRRNKKNLIFETFFL